MCRRFTAYVVARGDTPMTANPVPRGGDSLTR